MRQQLSKIVLFASLSLNLLVSVPALVLIAGSPTLRLALYQDILAPRLGRPEIAFLGDSMTRDGGIWALRIAHYDFNTWNLGQGGLTTRQIAHYQAKQAAALKSRYAFVMAGINDPDKSKDGADVSFGHYREMLETLRAAGVEPIIQLTLYREHEPNPEFIDRLNHRLTDYAARQHLTVIDLNRLLSHQRSLRPEYSRDGIHLTEAAYEIWAAEVRKVLQRKAARGGDNG